MWTDVAMHGVNVILILGLVGLVAKLITIVIIASK